MGGDGQPKTRRICRQRDFERVFALGGNEIQAISDAEAEAEAEDVEEERHVDMLQDLEDCLLQVRSFRSSVALVRP